MLYQHERCQ